MLRKIINCQTIRELSTVEREHAQRELGDAVIGKNVVNGKQLFTITIMVP